MNPSFPRPAQLQSAMRVQIPQPALAYAQLQLPRIHILSYTAPGALPSAGENISRTGTRASTVVSRGHSRENSRLSRRAVPYALKKRVVAQKTSPVITPPSARAVPSSSRDAQPVPEERPRASHIGPIRADPLNGVAKSPKESKKAERMERCKISLQACVLVDSVGEASVRCKACRRNVTLDASYELRAWKTHLREDTACIRKRVEMVDAGKLSLSVLELKYPWARQRVNQK